MLTNTVRYRGGGRLIRPVSVIVKNGVSRGARSRRVSGRMLGMGRLVTLADAEREGLDRLMEGRMRGGALGGVRALGEGKDKRPVGSGEYRILVGMGVMGSRVRLEMEDRRELYLGRELMALATYGVVGYRRGSAYATEAGRKYFRLGARGSTLLILGVARIYGSAGMVSRVEREAYGLGNEAGSSRGVARVVWVMRLKLGAMPVHRWVADIYEGAATMSGRYLRRVPKRSRRMVRVSLMPSLPREWGVAGGALSDVQVRRRWVAGLGSVRVGVMGRVVQLRWKRYMAYSGIATVGNMRIGVRRMTGEGRKGTRRTRRAYMRMVRRMWGTRMRMGVETVYHSTVGHPAVGSQGKKAVNAEVVRSERKYVTERRGLGKENVALGLMRTGVRMSRLGRPPTMGFGAKRSVRRATVEASRVTPYGWLRELATLSLLFGMIGVYGYLRRVKRMRMEPECKQSSVVRVVKKEGGMRMGRGLRMLTVRWRDGEGLERALVNRPTRW